MCLFKNQCKKAIEIKGKFEVGQFVDFFYRDDVYFGTISDIKKDSQNKVIYDIDIAGQCPQTYTGIIEEKVIRIHK